MILAAQADLDEALDLIQKFLEGEDACVRALQDILPGYVPESYASAGLRAFWEKHRGDGQ